MKNRVLDELGSDTVFSFIDAGKVYLYWKGKLQEFTNKLELQTILHKLAKQYQKLQDSMKDLQDVPYESNIVPKTLQGEQIYALEWKDKNGHSLGYMYSNTDGVQLRLPNGETTEGEFSPSVITDLLSNQ